MRKYLLLPLLLAACGADDPETFERTFAWEAPTDQQVTAAAFLPDGSIFVGLAGAAPQGVFLTADGEADTVVEIAPLCDECGAIRPAQPLLVGDYAFFGPEAGGEPLLRIEAARRRIRHLPLENPRGLQVGTFFLDGSRAAAKPSGRQMLLPGDRLLDLSIEGIVTATHLTPGVDAIAEVAHVRDDVYAFISAGSGLHGWREGDNQSTSFALAVSRIAGGDGFTVIGFRPQPETIDLFLYADPMEPLGRSFTHEIELAVAPAAGRLVVGVLETPLVADQDSSDAPPPRTALVLDGSGKVLGKAKAPTPISAVHISTDGKRALVAHEGGVLGFDIR